MRVKNIIIFTDGSSIGNPGPGGWGAIISLPHGRIKEFGGRDDHTTNNKMELKGAIEALNFIYPQKMSTVYTDSSYLVNGITKWIHSWQRSGWITKAKEPVLNKELWEELYRLNKQLDVEWHHVSAHVGIPANERVDEIAQGLARGEKVILYDGSIDQYDIDLNPDALPIKTKSKGKAYSYVSMVQGEIQTHATWKGCEARVRGKSGAKFKKAVSADDEQRIISDFSH